MADKQTLILVVLDESGSMGVKQGDVIGGFNRFLRDQQRLPDPCRLGIVTFNTTVTRALAPRPIAEVPPLDAQTYVPGGNTALLDAVGTSVAIAGEHRREGERVLMLIITDGEENSSTELTLAQVRDLIARKEAEGCWTFAYLGVEPEQWADRMGVGRGGSAQYLADDPTVSFSLMSDATRSFRLSDAMQSREFYGQEDDQTPQT
jgi:Mg-chelatase subunit ChlD